MESIPGLLQRVQIRLGAKSTMASLPFSVARPKRGGGRGYDVMQLRSHLLSSVIENLQFELVQNFPSGFAWGPAEVFFSTLSPAQLAEFLISLHQKGMKWKATTAHASSLDLIQFQAGSKKVLLTMSLREVIFLPRSSTSRVI